VGWVQFGAESADELGPAAHIAQKGESGSSADAGKDAADVHGAAGEVPERGGLLSTGHSDAVDGTVPSTREDAAASAPRSGGVALFSLELPARADAAAPGRSEESPRDDNAEEDEEEDEWGERPGDNGRKSDALPCATAPP
jgi:hypothetical protein